MNKFLVGNDFPNVVVPLLSQVKKTIDVIVFDWRFFPTHQADKVFDFNNSFLAAKTRGVQIRVIANNDAVKAALTAWTIPCKRLKSFKMVHAKFLLLDNELLICGSHNFTQGAFGANLEISVAVDDSFLLKEAKAYFDKLWAVI